ncbi:hypothetical protein BZM27_39620 [Paraburkholderia steynii]|uniref:Phage tail protein n=1 Tax=Paraburkholderia steynii TaxID=1245441 RepID=A0A4R0XF02_9BURK|nr:hypothetical protein BZM27_39620 [Paraburkholderia steynii]
MLASWLNMIQEEMRAVVVAAGITPSKTTYNQVLAAIKRIGQNTVVLADAGAANAYTAVNATPLVAGTWIDGVVQAVKIAHVNTGASTYAPDGLPTIPIYGLGLQPLQGGELAPNGTAILMRATIAGVNSGNPIAVLMECAGGAQQVAAATQSGHAAQLGQVGVSSSLQTIQALTGSRVIGTTYTNSTGRPIFVMANIGSSGAAVASAQLNAIQIGAVSIPAGGFGSFQWIVPPGATYGVAISSGGTLSVNSWAEIR